MTATKKEPVLVVLQLTGGNDYMNTVIPHADPLYRDNRPVVGVADDRIVKLNDRIGLHPEVAPLQRFWDTGDLAIVHGVGYANSPPQPLPQHGHLAHLRAGQAGHGRLAGPRHPRH